MYITLKLNKLKTKTNTDICFSSLEKPTERESVLTLNSPCFTYYVHCSKNWEYSSKQYKAYIPLR